METQFMLLKFITIIVNIYRIIRIMTKTGFNSVGNKLRNGFEWIFQLDSSYLSTTIFNYAVPFYTETECNDERFGHFSTMIMLLWYFRRRSSVVPYMITDVNHGRRSSSTDCTRVVSLRRVRVLENITAGLYNAFLRDIFQGVLIPWHNRHNCMFCRAIYRNITQCRFLAQLRQCLQLPIPDGMEGHTYAHIRQRLQLTIQNGMERHTYGHIRPFQLPEISNAIPHAFCCPGQRIRHLMISTERLTLLIPYNSLHVNCRVTLNSLPFFVRGLRLCLRIYPNEIADGRMSYMSVFLVLADTHILSCNDRSFPLVIRVTLMANQRRDINMAYTVVVQNPISWSLRQSSYVNEFGFEMFVSHHMLEHYFIREGVVTFIIELND